MKNVKEINIKHGTCYFLIDMINIEEFDSNLLRIDKKSYKDIDISYVDTLKLKKMMIRKIFQCKSFLLDDW